ncbi:MAG TPA: hypothetical protein PL163_03600 [Leptospiraceae bacterium]|nr:hypothetical protein [Leptospiraceae bacterium]
MKIFTVRIILIIFVLGCSSFRNDADISLESGAEKKTDFSMIQINCTNYSDLFKGGENSFKNQDDSLRFSRTDCRKNLLLIETENREEISFLFDGSIPEEIIQYNYITYNASLNPGSSGRKFSFLPLKTAGYLNSGRKEKHWDTVKYVKTRYLLTLKRQPAQYRSFEIRENGKTVREYSAPDISQ